MKKFITLALMLAFIASVGCSDSKPTSPAKAPEKAAEKK